MKIFLIIIDLALMALNIYLGVAHIGELVCLIDFFAAGACAMSAIAVTVIGE